ncbi:bifunctional glycosyltransferase family 2/GtrA family protein [Frigoribacterium faeni]|uniref:dolichyl-phosphate beta-glucosyltransferase n=1 Tax=Frigoribacterium faeni TaxID=145483 RepID=A0A7W3PJ19_9MICO|nr:bifunctional glycosyltransferase family 2/GtrA family protein [Frigoribacterium faeni]MBA8813372.1 putative flippase GtrA [Frigoribacterium faeni]BFF14602.1 bifunctional glycosyltransferase family 2/GtrA family protein [Microbacterium flavescens]GEK83112.1 sugar translocase [Frigoribacterium faeni]
MPDNDHSPRPDGLRLDIVVPVYDEAATLEASIASLHDHLTRHVADRWRVTIADNASTDGTAELADRLAARLPGVIAVHLSEKGRGRALKQVWAASPADVLVYLDEDLSTDLSALGPLVAPLLSGHSDLAIGTRLSRSSRVVRGGKREFISRSYNLLLRRTMGVGFSDAQCGFKAIRREAAERLLPLVEDTGWFFDTELLILAERSGLRIHEVPVDWVDDPDSSVDIVSTAVADLKGMVRVGTGIARGTIPVQAVYEAIGRRPFDPPAPPTFFSQVVRFGVVGVASTAAYALLYLVMLHLMPPQAANFVALLVTAVFNTAANRRFTFGVRGSSGVARHQLQGLMVFGLAWLLTSGSLVVLHTAAPSAGAHAELAVLTAANLVATVLRFALLRVWVFRSQATHVTTGPADERASASASPPASRASAAHPAPVSDLTVRFAAVADDDDVSAAQR